MKTQNNTKLIILYIVIELVEKDLLEEQNKSLENPILYNYIQNTLQSVLSCVDM